MKEFNFRHFKADAGQICVASFTLISCSLRGYFLGSPQSSLLMVKLSESGAEC